MFYINMILRIFEILEENRPIFYQRTEEELYQIKKYGDISYEVIKIIKGADFARAFLRREGLEDFLKEANMDNIKLTYPYDVIQFPLERRNK